MFAKRFPVVSPLHAVQHHVSTKVGAVKKVAMPVEIKSPGVAAAFTEELEFLRQRMIAPHPLLKLEPTNVAR